MNSIIPDELDPSISSPSGFAAHGTTYGASVSWHGRRRIPVAVKRLKERGVRLSRHERDRQDPLIGELVVLRMYERNMEQHSMARLLERDGKGFLTIKAQLGNPTIFAADERGLILYGHELRQLPGQDFSAPYLQAWLCQFR